MIKAFRKIKFSSLESKNSFYMTLAGMITLIFVLCLSPLFYWVTKENLAENMSGTVSETAVRLSYLLSYHRPLKQLTEDPEFLELLRSYYDEPENQDSIRVSITAELNTYEEGKRDSDSGAISGTNYFLIATDCGDCFYQESIQNLAEEFLKSDWYQTFVKGDFEWKYSPVLYLTEDDGERTAVLCFMQQFSVEEITCYAIHLAEFDDYLRQMEELEKVGIYDYMLYCDGEILYQSAEDTRLSPESYDSGLFSKTQYEVKQKEQSDGFDFITLCTLNGERYYLITHISKEALLAPYQSFFLLLRVCLITLVVFMVSLSCVINHFSLKRLSQLSRQMLEIQEGNYDIDLTDNTNDEIGNVRKTASQMITKIRSEANEKLQAKETEKQIQYALMVSAIDPHFIYNTLNTISFLAAMGRNEDVIKVNDALIGTLKDRLSMKTYKTFDSVSVEIQVVKNYMVIQNYLHQDRIECVYQVAEDARDLQIPKNLLQPLVENAIKHGLLSNKEEDRLNLKKGIITIGVNRAGDQICLFVADNGTGMTQEQCNYYMSEHSEAEFSAEHIGLMNMKQRLSYLYQKNYQFIIESTLGKETKITILLPAEPL